MRRTITVLIAALGGLIFLAGCNTVRGFGQDVTQAADTAAEWGRVLQGAGQPAHDTNSDHDQYPDHR